MNNTGSALLICFGTYIVQGNGYGWLLILAGIFTWLIPTHKDKELSLLELNIKKLELEIKSLEKNGGKK